MGFFDDIFKLPEVPKDAGIPKPPKQYEPIGINGQPGDKIGGTSQVAGPAIGGSSDVGQINWTDFANQYFKSPEMQELMDLRRKGVEGMSAAERLRLVEQGQAGINSQLGTGLRSLSSSLASRGVKGGAATGAAMPLLMHSSQQRAGLERDVNLANDAYKARALDAYEKSLTGQNAAILGTIFGGKGLDATIKNNEQLFGLSKEQLEVMKDILKGMTSGGGGGDGPVETTVSPGNPATSIFGRDPAQGLTNFLSVLGGPYTALGNYGYQKANGTDADPRTWWD